MLDAVIFDWGGVVAEDPSWPLTCYCAEVLAVPPQQFKAAFEKFGRHLQTGLIDEDTFWSLTCAELGVARPRPCKSLWGQAFRAVYRPRPEVLLLIERLKASGIRTCLLSNTEPPCVDFFMSLGYRCFDQTVFSCKVGTVKPEGRIYRLALERLQSLPTGTLFIDDRPSFVMAAKGLGLHAEPYQGVTWLHGLLQGLGVSI